MDGNNNTNNTNNTNTNTNTNTNNTNMNSTSTTSTSSSPRFSKQRLKYWVSTVAAVIDPTLPSPPPLSLQQQPDGTTVTTIHNNTVVSDTAASLPVVGSPAAPLPPPQQPQPQQQQQLQQPLHDNNNNTASDHDNHSIDDNDNNGTYVPPQIPILDAIPQNTFTPSSSSSTTTTTGTATTDTVTANHSSYSVMNKKNDHLDTATHPLKYASTTTSITTSKQDDIDNEAATTNGSERNDDITSTTGISIPSLAPPATIDDDSNNSKDRQHNDTTTFPTTSSIFPRLQTWKKQVNEAVLSATTTASTSKSGTVTTATAAAAKASALMKQHTTSLPSWNFTTTTSANSKKKLDDDHAVPVIENVSHVRMTMDDADNHDTDLNENADGDEDREEKKDDQIVAKTTPTATINVSGVTPTPNDGNVEEGGDSTSDSIKKSTSSSVLDTSPNVTTHTGEVTTTTTTTNDTEPESQRSNADDSANVKLPTSPVAASTTTASMLSSSFRTSLQQWSTSVAGAKKSSTIVDSTISMLPKDVFRGRYASSATTEQPAAATLLSTRTTSGQQQSVESQAIRIGKLSSTSDHWSSLTSQLQPHEYILLLGRGMLGVNLKQCYKLHHGVYVDYLVPNGSADRSQLVLVGDIIISIGKVDGLKNGTIATIPSIIANATRPVHITFSTSGCCSSSTSSRDSPNPSMNYIDIAIGLLHGACTTTKPKTIAPQECPNVTNDAATAVSHEPNDEETPTTTDCPFSPMTGESNFSTTGSNETMDTEDSMSLVQPTSFDLTNHDDVLVVTQQGGCRIPDLLMTTTTKLFDIDQLIYPTSPPQSICRAYMSHVAKRNIDPKLITLDYITATYHCSTSVRCAIQNAFIVCLSDRRRYKFIKRFIDHQQDDIMKQNQDEESDASCNGSSLDMIKNYNVLWLLFMEMYDYVDLYDVVPLSKNRDMVKRIAYKYFLPIVNDNHVQSPQHDFHTIVSDTVIRKLEAAMKNTTDKYPRSMFIDFQQATFVSLTDSVFLPFLISNDCARMRAYLRNTVSYVNVPISTVISTTCSTDITSSTAHAQNFFTYCLVYLLCMMEQEEFGENDDLLLDLVEQGASGRGARVENAATAICAAIRIKRQVIPAVVMTQTKWKERENTTRTDNDSSDEINGHIKSLMMQLEQLWEIYVAPGVGSLVEGPTRTTAVQSLQTLRLKLLGIQRRSKDCTSYRSIIDFLIDPILLEQLNDLADELLHDYAVRLYPKFRVHKFHEWVCDEIMQDRIRNSDNAENDNVESPLSSPANIPAIASGCVKRLLRKTKFPVGITPHQSSHDIEIARDTNSADDVCTSRSLHCNADCAIVFGTRLDTDGMTSDDNPVLSMDNIIRYTCQSVHSVEEVAQQRTLITPEEIPITLESYAYVPLSRPKPFDSKQTGSYSDANEWEISLVNFMLPRADAASQNARSIYGVSLMFQYRGQSVNNDSIPVELSIEPHVTAVSDTSPVSTFDEDDMDDDDMEADTSEGEMSWFDRLLKQQQQKSSNDGSDQVSIAIGLALVCQKNHIYAMRETLSLLLKDFTTERLDDSAITTTSILTLINRLGQIADPNIESSAANFSLRTLLDPYVHSGSQSWIDRPLGTQTIEFLRDAGQQLIQCLPPIPMALLFITALLEQKIVITSNRRSILLSATTALQEMLRPLQWCHLILAHVPAALANDLLQYPAPFILGLASSDPGITEMLRELPPDITLVDLDIGRVILAPSFGHDSEFARRPPALGTAGLEPSTENNIRILRSQVLYLAQCWGNTFGAQLYPSTWCCDHPPLTANTKSSSPSSMGQFDTVRTLCHDFIQEVLAGTTSCCYYLEEANVSDTKSVSNTNDSSVVGTVLFDEDQFFHIKDARYQYGHTSLFPIELLTMNEGSGVSPRTTTNTTLALSMNEFDCIIELLLRCQCMNEYIGTRQRHDMAYYTK